MVFTEQSIDEYDSLLESYFSSCVKQIDTNTTIPYFQVREDPTVVQHFIEFYRKILDESKLNEQNI
jgi:hypothetical protein